MISELARRGLTGPPPANAGVVDAEEGEEFFGVRPLPHRGVVVTNELINRLREADIY